MLDTYQLNLAGLLLACGVLVATRPSTKTKARTPTANTTSTSTSTSRSKAKSESSNNAASEAEAERPSSQKSFFLVYALVMASDWLQGPFLYSLYRDEHALPPQLIPALFTTGFLAGALAPFGASALLVGAAAVCMLVAWDENYGATGTSSESDAKKQETTSTTVSLWNTLTTPGMLALTVASTAFEGSMYLFVVLWAPVLEPVAASSSSSPEPLPYGLIFASFMSATLLSSLAYPRLTAHLSPPTLLALLLATASLLLHALASRPAGPQPAFWLFCAFEAVVGAYFPAQATLKNALLMGEGSADAAGRVFAVCALLLQSLTLRLGELRCLHWVACTVDRGQCPLGDAADVSLDDGPAKRATGDIASHPRPLSSGLSSPRHRRRDSRDGITMFDPDQGGLTAPAAPFV
ncbi:UDP-galactose transporter-like protein 1 [Verticillium dahliae VDG2]|nr:UDP-galactose transporter-like protein 1 [Verticillium dahliae VDG2]